MSDFFSNKLPSFVLSHMISYLSARDIYLVFSLSNRFLYEFIKRSPYLSQEIPFRSLGIDPISLKTLTSLPEKQLISMISSKFIRFLQQNYAEIPFFGFYTDGGIDNDNAKHWVNTAFLKGTWEICTRSGRNVHLKGSLQSELRDVAYSLRLFHEIAQDFQKNNYFYLLEKAESTGFSVSYVVIALIIKPLIKEIQSYQQKKSHGNLSDESEVSDEDFEPKAERKTKKIKKKQKISAAAARKKRNREPTPFNLVDALAVKDEHFDYWKYTRHELFEKLIPGIKTMAKKDIKYQAVQENNTLELIDFNTLSSNPQRYALIKGVEVSRMGIFTCPVRTCVLFASDNDFPVKNSKLMDIFSTAKTVHDFKTIFEDNSLDLPSIYHTNCPELKSKAIMPHKPSKLDENIARFVVFNNNNHNNKRRNNEDLNVKPMVWLQFVEKDFVKLKITFDHGRTFGARFVCVKLIDCEDRTREFGYLDDETNIDINYVSFFGDVIDFNDEHVSLS